MNKLCVRGLIPLILISLCIGATPAIADDNPLQAALKTILGQIEADPKIRVAGEQVFMQQELLEFYRERDYRPLWSTEDPQGRSQIRGLLTTLESSFSNGLCEADYHLPFFRDLLYRFSIDDASTDRPPLRWSGWYDLLLTDGLIHYSLHLTEGRVPADAAQEGWNLRKQEVDLMQVVNASFENDNLGRLLNAFQPTHKDYRALLKALLHYREIEAFGGWPPIPDGETLRAGQNDPRVPLLRTRLLLSGDLTELPASDSRRLEAEDLAALKRFQRRHGLQPDGVLGGRTLAALNVPVAERVRQIGLNLERWRWLPKQLGDKYILVNIAAFTVSVIDKGKTVLSMPAVVGTEYRKTPVFSAQMQYIEFSPYWYVPRTILEEDKLPLIKADPGYLERNHYELVSWNKQEVIDPKTIDWKTVEPDTFPGLLRQQPGPWNALGRVKFMLPNRYAIYLHDTNERHLFNRRERQFSSGCIRLKKPVELAEHLLADQGWDSARIKTAMAADAPQRLDLKQSLPVHILYWTAWVDDNGQLQFREDAYGRDQDLLRALSQTPSACRFPNTALARNKDAATVH